MMKKNNNLRNKLRQKDDENTILRNRIKDMEKELNACRMVVKEKDNLLKDKDKRIIELDYKLKQITHQKVGRKKQTVDENEELAFALERIHNMENKPNNNTPLGVSQNNHFALFEEFTSSNSRPQMMLQNLANRMMMLNEMMIPVNIEQNVMNQVCPNPDTMSYEQLLELQEKIGFVDKGLKKEDVEKVPTIKYSKYKSSTDRCTVCQFEFDDGEILRKLNCGHLYHKGCVDDWLKKDKRCPVCKNEVKV